MIVKFENDLIKKTLLAINGVVEDASLIIEQEQLRMSLITESHTEFMSINILSDEYTLFGYDESKKIRFDMDRVVEVFKLMKKDDSITFDIDDSELKIILESDTKRTFSIILLDEEEDLPILPERSYTNEFNVPAKVFKEFLKSCSVNHETACISIKEGDDGSLNKLVMSSKGDLGGSVNETTVESRGTGEATARFNINKLMDIVAASGFDEYGYIKVNFSTNSPIEAVMKNNGSEFRIVLAPMMTEEDIG